MPSSPHGIHLTLVVAAAENGVIGRGGGLPWRLKSDMQHFRRVTMGKPVVMGRKSFLSIGRALPGRTNIVVSRVASFAAPGIVVAPSLARALEVAHADALRRGSDAIAVIGGADIFAQTMASADRIVLTRVHMHADGDTFLPPIGGDWRETGRSVHPPGPDDEAGFDIVTYTRVAAPRP